jgi:transglutaminase-like putative cysteine protease
MVLNWLLHAWQRFRPRYGWLPFALLLAALGCLILSVLEVEWTPEDGGVVPLVLLGFILSAILAQRDGHPALVGLVLILVGLALALILVAGFIPPLDTVVGGGETLLDYWRLRSALFADRAAGWLRAVTAGQRSTETVVFALLLTFAGWLVAAALAFSVYRIHRPYVGLTIAGLALAANTFYGGAGLYWVVVFFTLAVVAATYLNYLFREIEWERSGADYSAEVRGELLSYAAGISLGLASIAMSLPAIDFRALAEVFQRQEAVVEAEQTLARVFAGVQSRSDEGTIAAGGLPRSFLLGGDPELAETVVMTATVAAESGVTPEQLAGHHWRSVSFDVYTGQGWARSPEREENVDAGQPIPPAGWPPATDARLITIEQEIDWIFDRRATRYMIGRPIIMSHDVTSMWRGQEDFVGLRSRNNAPSRYTALTQLAVATPDQLRAARLEETPPEIRARYTALPDSVPERVRQLAFQAAGLAGGQSQTPYDQARAIETFLHQYPYSLDISRPPPDVDVVDYFLFDLQTGFCDYYASAMVVMARAVGLPARLGVGFLQQPADSAGIQTIRQIDAHSWAEIYFPGYGWIEFEPTAPFAGQTAPPPSVEGTAAPAATFAPPTSVVTIPERAPQRDMPWILILGVAALLLVGWRLWGRRWVAHWRTPQPALDDVQRAFGQLQESAGALGFPVRPSQTPAEFAAELLAGPVIPAVEQPGLDPPIRRLAQLFAAHSYGGDKLADSAQEAQALWGALRAPLRRLIWRRRFGRRD